jgi:nitrate reductase molybdenum cofactor assembly chaperone NarJ/NarW
MSAAADVTAAVVVCQAAAVLLQYPDEAMMRDRLPVVASAVTALPAGSARSDLAALVAQLSSTEQRELAEHYVATFDRRKRCCLHLTWWADGETRRRGQALAELKERYRRSGLDLTPSELPDFLPVVLEYAAVADVADGLALLQEHRAGLELLRLALEEAPSPYTAAVRAVCSLLPGESPRDRAEARRLARSGPPVESVGLEPFGITGLLPVVEGGARR